MSPHGSNQTLRLTPHQLATVLVFDGAIAMLQTGANQLGGFLKLKAEADVLISAIELIGSRKVALQKEWGGGIVIAKPADVPRMLQP